MTPQDWEKVKQIAADAMELPESELAAFLTEACGDDLSLRDEVESLVRSGRDTGTFVLDETRPYAETGPGDYPVTPAGQVDIGSKVGPYVLKQIIGIGGMGAVYLAERTDAAFEKKVALKLMLGGRGPDFQRRFLAERQLLARLEHANIVRLLDGGATAEGYPYFVMDFVEGVSIDAYVEQAQLTVEQRVELFRQVCSAVHYAHQNLVVHRDLKPGNILVTHDGVPKLLDFGIAKLLTATNDITRTKGQSPHTPQYASPEQINNQPVSTASDVYSLGVILYRLLTGLPPHHTDPDSTPLTIYRQVLETDPPPMSVRVRKSGGSTTLARKLEGDLDTIAAMAMRKEPQRRYASVEQFSEDLRRYLTGLPVIAQQDTLSYRSGKFLRRNWIAAGAAAAVFVTLCGGVVATLQQSSIARERAEEALRQRGRAEEQTGRAERRTGDLRELTTALLAKSAGEQSRRAAIEQTIAKLEELAAVDPRLRANLALGYVRMGELEHHRDEQVLADPAKALEWQTKAKQVAVQAREANPRVADLAIAQASHRIGDIYIDTERFAEAEKSLLESIATGERLVQETGADPAAQFGLALAIRSLGELQRRSAKTSVMRGSFERTIKLLEALTKSEPKNSLYQAATADTKARLAAILRSDLLDSGSTEATGTAEESRLRRRSVENPQNLGVQRALASFYTRQASQEARSGRTETAAGSYRKAIDVLRKATAAGNPRAIEQQAYIHVQFSEDLWRASQQKESLAENEAAIQLRRKLVALNPRNNLLRRDLAIALERLASKFTELVDSPKAMALLEEAAGIQTKLASSDPERAMYLRDRANNYLLVGQLHQEQRRYQEALSAFRAGQELSERSGIDADEMNIQRAEWLYNIGDALRGLKDRDAAKANWEKAIAILEPLERTKPGNRRVMSNLVLNYAQMARGGGSEDYFNRAIRLQVALLNQDSSDLRDRETMSALVYDLGRRQQAAKQMHLAEGNFLEAQRHYDLLHRASPSNVKFSQNRLLVRLMLSITIEDQNRALTAALESCEGYEELIKEHPEFLRNATLAQLSAARRYLLLKDSDKAANHFEVALRSLDGWQAGNARDAEAMFVETKRTGALATLRDRVRSEKRADLEKAIQAK